jgi:hypothetical protein
VWVEVFCTIWRSEMVRSVGSVGLLGLLECPPPPSTPGDEGKHRHDERAVIPQCAQLERPPWPASGACAGCVGRPLSPVRQKGSARPSGPAA